MNAMTQRGTKWSIGYKLGMLYHALWMSLVYVVLWTRLGYPLLWVPEVSLSGLIGTTVFLLLLPVSYVLGMLFSLVTYYIVKSTWGLVT